MTLPFRCLVWASGLVATRPWIALATIGMITILLGTGILMRAPQAEDIGFLPPDTEVARAMNDLETLFGNSAEITVVTVIFRGELFTPSGLAQMEGLLDRITEEPGVAELVATGHSITAPSLLIASLLQVDSLESLNQERIDSVLRQVETSPELHSERIALSSMTGTDKDGSPISVATIRLSQVGHTDLKEAQWKIHEMVEYDSGPLRARSVSLALVEREYQEATGPDMLPLVGVAILVVSLVLLLFMRSLLDLLLTLAGIVITLIWTLGTEGWLGPNALGLIGPPNALGALVPVILISLSVDYSIQVVAHYREQRNAGQKVTDAIGAGLRMVIIPVSLAGVTTVISFLTGLLSPISEIGDFGVVAGLGVGFSLIVMLSLVPAAHAVIDRRREAQGRLPPARPIARALPGVSSSVEKLNQSQGEKRRDMG